ncbi:MAG: hypothetical protein KKF44_02180, partial [Nanoarchaeota archaeon]|nr:hypothetical protein [Nanoarchaeota archaeon]
ILLLINFVEERFKKSMRIIYKIMRKIAVVSLALIIVYVCNIMGCAPAAAPLPDIPVVPSYSIPAFVDEEYSFENEGNYDIPEGDLSDQLIPVDFIQGSQTEHFNMIMRSIQGGSNAIDSYGQISFDDYLNGIRTYANNYAIVLQNPDELKYRLFYEDRLNYYENVLSLMQSKQPNRLFENSNKIIIYIQDIHSLPETDAAEIEISAILEVQKNIYYLLSEFYNGISNSVFKEGRTWNEDPFKICLEHNIGGSEKVFTGNKELIEEYLLNKDVKNLYSLEGFDSNPAGCQPFAIFRGIMPGPFLYKLGFEDNVNLLSIESKRTFDYKWNLAEEIIELDATLDVYDKIYEDKLNTIENPDADEDFKAFKRGLDNLYMFYIEQSIREKKIDQLRGRDAVNSMIRSMDSNNIKVGVLVFGIDHTYEIVDELEKNMVSYIVIQPHGTELTEYKPIYPFTHHLLHSDKITQTTVFA